MRRSRRRPSAPPAVPHPPPSQIPVILGAVLVLASLSACASTRPTVATADGGAACSTAARPPAGMRVLTLVQLPAQALATLRLIAAGGPYPYAEDGTVFGNYQRLLPSEKYGYYHEYTVAAAHARDRGPIRVVTGSGGQDYYTPDHYVSFDWIACG
jgi:ribonuclease T1